jgi:thiamine kinase-like enzyme
MLFSGYQLGIHLLNSTFVQLSLERDEVVKHRKPISIIEKHLNKNAISRNSIFIVSGPIKGNDKATFFVKQPRFDDSNYKSSILNEKYILELFGDLNFSDLAILIGFDQYQYLLFQRYIDGKTFNNNRKPSDDYLNKILTELSQRFFSKIHSVASSLIKSNKYPDRFGYRKPLFFAFSPKDFEELLIDNDNPLQNVVINLLRDSEYKLLSLIQELNWRQDTLIHFDFKFEHLILKDDESINTLVDWEMGDMGDIYWDIACIWFEVLQPFMYSKKTGINDLLDKSAEHLNAFFAVYSQKIDFIRLQKFLGVVILHNQFYGLFNKYGLSDDKLSEWFGKAVDLIKSTKVDYKFNDYKPQIKTISIKNQPPAILKKEVSNERNTMGTVKDTTDISKRLFQKFITDKSTDKVSEFVYSWFNGSMDNNKVVDLREVIAKSQMVGQEKLLEDFWWQVEGYSKNNSVIIRKESERRVADPGSFIYLNYDSRYKNNSKAKSYVKLQYPRYVVRANDAKEESNDLWIYSDQQIRQDYGNWVRFYFNLKGNIDGINIFIDAITEKLNERGIPFQLKLRNALSSYIRNDVAILFVHRQHFNACLDTVAHIYVLLKDKYLGKGTPQYTKRFIGYDGIAFAENPTISSESFGNWRAKLIEKVVIENLNTFKSANDIKVKIEEMFSSLGFNIYELYRNPYTEKYEYKYRYDRLVNRLKANISLDSGISGSLKYLPSQRFLKAARSIGFIICREAIWYGDYCTWLGFKKDKDKNNEGYFTTLNESELLGIGLFLCYLWKLCPNDSIFKDCTIGILKTYIEGKQNIDISRDRCLTLLQDKLKTFPLEWQKSSNSPIDLLGGIEVQGLYNDEFKNPEGKSRFLADVLIEKYLDKRVPIPNGYADSWNDDTGTEFNPTVTKGLAGIGYFFLTLLENEDLNLTLIRNFNKRVEGVSKL